MSSQELKAFEKIFCIPKIYKKILDNSANPIAIVDHQGTIMYVNKLTVKWAGFKQSAIIGKKFYDLPFFTPETIKLTKSKFALRTKDTKQFSYEISFVAKGGDKMYGNINALPIYDQKDKFCGEIIEMHNITKFKQQEGELNLTRRAIEAAHDAIVFTDKDLKIVYVNPSFLKIFGLKNEKEALGKKTINFLKDKKEGLYLEKIIRQDKKKKFHIIDVVIKKKDGSTLLTRAMINPIRDDFGDIEYWFGFIWDIAKEMKDQELIKYHSTHDELTGLYNRFFAKQEIVKMGKEQIPLGVIIGDVNGLKLINDAFGHTHGDELLKSIADVLKRSLRKGDIVARWGGDEFIIILPKANEKIITDICDRIHNNCKKVFRGPIILSISLGWAIKNNKKEDTDIVIKKAEDQMYVKKTLEDKSVRNLIMRFLVRSLKEKNTQNPAHHKRIENLIREFAIYLHLHDYDINQLEILSTLHDIGKISISNDILRKSQPLEEKDWEAIKQHPLIGYRILKSIPELAQIAPIVLAHHERWDGNGYPQGLKGDKIPFLARILSIIDAYDVMVFAKRSYKKNISKKAAISELKKCAGTQFDPNLIKQFEAFIKTKRKP